MKKETLVVRSDSLATVAVMENCFFGDKPFMSLQNSWVSEEDWEFYFFSLIKILENKYVFVGIFFWIWVVYHAVKRPC